MEEKINMKKGEINNNILESNILRGSNTSSSSTCSFNTWNPILAVFKVETKNSKNFDRFTSVLIESINLNP